MTGINSKHSPIRYWSAKDAGNFIGKHNLYPPDYVISDYKMKNLLRLYEEYLSFIVPDDPCHFWNYIHLTGRYDYLPAYEVLSGMGFTPHHYPLATYKCNKNEVLGRPEGVVTYDDYRKMMKKKYCKEQSLKSSIIPRWELLTRCEVTG